MRASFQPKQLLPHRNDQSLKTRNSISCKPFYRRGVQPPRKVVAPSYSVVASPLILLPLLEHIPWSQVTQFKDTLWPQKLFFVLNLSFILLSLSFQGPLCSWLKSFFPRVDFQSDLTDTVGWVFVCFVFISMAMVLYFCSKNKQTTTKNHPRTPSITLDVLLEFHPRVPGTSGWAAI